MLTLRPGTIYLNKLQGKLNLVLSVRSTPKGYHSLMILGCEGQVYDCNVEELENLITG
jgi:hypothetical protein